MSFRTLVKTNIPKVDLQSYITLICGNYKSGKTRLWKELMEFYYPDEPNAGLLIAWEGGYRSWNLKSVFDLTEYQKNDGKKNKTELERDADRWEYFKKDIVRGLVQEASEGRISKIIGLDTVDRLIDCASAYLVVQANKKYGQNYESIQEMSEDKNYKENVWLNLYDELKRPVDTIRAAGYGLIFLAWTKERTTELYDGRKYNSIELMMNQTARKVFQSQADLICCLHNDVVIFDKDGNELTENLQDKRGKEKATNFHKTEANMYFRESEYIGIAGGRFINLPEKVPYSVENFDRVFREAVEGNLGGNKNIEELRQKEVEEREKAAKEYSDEYTKQAQEGDTVESIISQIDEKLAEYPDKIDRTKISDKFKEIFNGDNNYRKVTDVVKLQEALEYVKQYKKQ